MTGRSRILRSEVPGALTTDLPGPWRSEGKGIQAGLAVTIGATRATWPRISCSQGDEETDPDRPGIRVSRADVFDDAASRQLEAVYLTPDVVRQRAETRTLLDLHPGERVLDVGSGPGLLAAEMAADVAPSGHVTALDPSESMLAVSARRIGSPTPFPRVSLVGGDAVRLPFRANTFDAAVAVQVYEYVDDITAALAELHRVMRPGGRALILDTDWDSIVWNAEDRSAMQRMLDLWKKRFAHPHLPRTLSRHLQDAGFAVVRREVLVLLNPEYDPATYSTTNIEIMGAYLERHQGVSRQDVEAWKQDLRQVAEGGTYFFSLNRYLFLALKA